MDRVPGVCVLQRWVCDGDIVTGHTVQRCVCCVHIMSGQITGGLWAAPVLLNTKLLLPVTPVALALSIAHGQHSSSPRALNLSHGHGQQSVLCNGRDHATLMPGACAILTVPPFCCVILTKVYPNLDQPGTGAHCVCAPLALPSLAPAWHLQYCAAAAMLYEPCLTFCHRGNVSLVNVAMCSLINHGSILVNQGNVSHAIVTMRALPDLAIMAM